MKIRKQFNPDIKTPAKHLLDIHGAFICKDIITKDVCHLITHVLLRKSQIEGKRGDDQIPNALTVVSHDLWLETVHEQIWPMLEVILGEELLPTYAYSRLYNNGDILTKHKDRPACEISITVQLGRSHHYSWPIYVEGQPNYLAEGDGVVYRGCDVEHWREICTGPDGYYSGQAFFHFVRKNGSFAKEYGDGNRRQVTENHYLKHRQYIMESK